jgi:hypothetical protein
MSVGISSKLSFETGLLYAQKGFRYIEKDDYGSFDEKLNIAYLDIPLAFKMRFEAGRGYLYFLAGPYASIALKAKAKLEIKSEYFNEKSEEDIAIGYKANDEIRTFDFGLMAGTGYEWNRYQIGLTYQRGMANIWNGGDILNLDDSDYSSGNRCFNLTFTYWFREI